MTGIARPGRGGASSARPVGRGRRRRAFRPQLKRGLPSAIEDSTRQFSIGTVDLRALMEAKDPTVNILVLPDDVVSVPRAEMVYVVGEVSRTGGFILNERESMSLLEALSLAGGLNREAAADV